MSMMNFPDGPMNSDARDAILNLQRAESAEAQLHAIQQGHGELGRYEKLRLKNAALAAELAQEKAAHAGTHMLLDAREDELSKERARFDWIFHYTEVTHLINPSIPLDTISAIDKAMGNP